MAAAVGAAQRACASPRCRGLGVCRASSSVSGFWQRVHQFHRRLHSLISSHREMRADPSARHDSSRGRGWTPRDSDDPNAMVDDTRRIDLVLHGFRKAEQNNRIAPSAPWRMCPNRIIMMGKCRIGTNKRLTGMETIEIQARAANGTGQRGACRADEASPVPEAPPDRNCSLTLR